MKKPKHQLQENHVCTYKHLAFCGICERSNIKNGKQAANEIQAVTNKTP